jgi:activator of HSP90 ATPase
MKIKTDNIFQVIELDIDNIQAYNSLLDANLLSKLTGMKAELDNKQGGLFTAWDKKCSGYYTFLAPGARIVQAWTHKEFQEGQFSTVILDIESTEHGCRISFNHIGVPEAAAGWLTETWRNDFWTPVQEHFAVAAEAK